MSATNHAAKCAECLARLTELYAPPVVPRDTVTARAIELVRHQWIAAGLETDSEEDVLRVAGGSRNA